MKLSEIRMARRHFPYAPQRSGIKQAIALLSAKKYLSDNGIEAAKLGSQFQYQRSTGSIL